MFKVGRTASRASYDEFLEFYEPSMAVNWRDTDGDRLIHRALDNPDPVARAAITNRLLDDGADPTTISASNNSTLHILLCKNRHDFTLEPPLLQRLLDGGADINYVNKRWGTPLQGLTSFGQFSDEVLAPFYDIIFASPDLDLLKPGIRGMSTLRLARAGSDYRTDFLARVEQYLRAHGQEIPEDPENASRHKG